MNRERVAVAVVNYNGRAVLERCLAALERQTLPHRVVVVDNASMDGSARAAHAAFPRADYLPMRRNVGFARAVNLAAERLAGAADIMVTLNPDAVPEPAFLERLVAPFADAPRVGAVAGTLVFASRPDVIASAGIVVHRNGVALDARLGEPRPAPHAAPAPVFGASGGAAAYRLEAFRSVGGFPADFFMYLEDVDLAWRLRRAGWETLWAPSAVAAHDYSGSAGEGSAFKRRLLARNRLWTLARCLPGEIWARDWRSIVWFDIGAFAFGVARGDWAATRGRLEGAWGAAWRVFGRTDPRALAYQKGIEFDRWLAPPIGFSRLLRLRRLTARLATRSGTPDG